MIHKTHENFTSKMGIKDMSLFWHNHKLILKKQENHHRDDKK